MSIALHNPEALPEVNLYHQVSVSTGSRLVHVAGQVAVDAEGAMVGAGDLASQVAQCYRNIDTALASVGGSLDDVAKLTAYFVDWTPEKLSALAEGIARVSEQLGVRSTPPFTGVGVAALAEPGMLVEIEATAVLD